MCRFDLQLKYALRATILFASSPHSSGSYSAENDFVALAAEHAATSKIIILTEVVLTGG